MLEWNRNVLSIIQLLLVIAFFLLLLFKRKKLGEGIIYLIISSCIVVIIDTSLFFIFLTIHKFNSTPVYTIGMNFFVFLLFFLYFRKILQTKVFRAINLILILIFLVSYGSFAIFSETFFTQFSIRFYIIEVVILMCNIYLVLNQTFNSDKILNIKLYYPFWACIGLMATYLGVTPLLVISNTASEMMNINIFFLILFVVNLIGYSILITGIFYAKNINSNK